MTTQLLIPGRFAALLPAQDANVAFGSLVDDLESKHLLIPEHQRDPDAWDDEKRHRFVERVKQGALDGCPPPGTIATYQLAAGSPCFLNDGLQRTKAMADVRRRPHEYELDENGAAEVLRQQITRQHRIYPDHEYGMQEFQLMNAGTHLTPLEMCRGYLRYMDGYETIWEPLFLKIHGTMKATEARLGTSRKGGRETIHKHQRDDLALFYRFLSNDVSLSRYKDVSTSKVDRLVGDKDLVELKLRSRLLTLGEEKAKGEVSRFARMVEDETATLEDARYRILGSTSALQPVFWRWFLHFAVWRRNSGTPVNQQVVFLEKAMRATGGKSQWADDGKATGFSLAHLGKLPQFAELANMPDLVSIAKRRRRDQLMPGYHNSHMEPFAMNGEGETFSEPAPLNLARGARPVVEKTAANDV